MASPSTSTTPAKREIMAVWRADRCLGEQSAQQYLRWIVRLRRYCAARGLDERTELTRDGVRRFLTWQVRP